MRNTVCNIQLIALAFTLGGCGSFHLYDKSADQLVAGAKTDYEESKIIETLKSEHANFDALEKREVDAFLKVLAARRDLELLSLLSDSETPFVTRFKEMISQRVNEFSTDRGKDGKYGTDSIDSLNNQREKVRAAREKLADNKHLEEKQRDELFRFAVSDSMREKFAKLPECTFKNKANFEDATLAALDKAIGDETFTPSKLPFAPGLAQQYASYVKSCMEVLTSEADLAVTEQAFKSGSFGRAAKEAKVRADALAAQEAAVKEARAALKKATKNLSDAQKSAADAAKTPDLTCKEEKEATDPKTAVTETPDPEPNPVCSALAALKRLGDLGIKAVSEEQIEKINLMLAALSDVRVKEDKEAVPPALALLGAVPRFAGALNEYQTAGTIPALEPLIIERQLATARLAAAVQGHDLQKFQVALAREKYDALLTELDLLLQANAVLGDFSRLGKCTFDGKDAKIASASVLMGNKKFQDRCGANESPQRMATRALSLFAESFSVARARYESADIRLILSDYRDSLNRSEAALMTWNALISTPLAQLQAYYSSGIKPDEIAQFLQAFGVVGIAARIK